METRPIEIVYMGYRRTGSKKEYQYLSPTEGNRLLTFDSPLKCNAPIGGTVSCTRTETGVRSPYVYSFGIPVHENASQWIADEKVAASEIEVMKNQKMKLTEEYSEMVALFRKQTRLMNRKQKINFVMLIIDDLIL